LFELIVRRKERLALIEKIGEKFDASMVENKFAFPTFRTYGNPFGTLKLACLLLGIGLGLIIGYHMSPTPVFNQNGYNTMNELTGVVFGGSVLLCGGFGLLISFIVEMIFNIKEKKSEK
jgi:hypothetical protein